METFLAVKWSCIHSDSSMKYVACLVRRFLELSPDHSMKDFNNVRVYQDGWFISLQEDIHILEERGVEMKIQSLPLKLED